MVPTCTFTDQPSAFHGRASRGRGGRGNRLLHLSKSPRPAQGRGSPAPSRGRADPSFYHTYASLQQNSSKTAASPCPAVTWTIIFFNRPAGRLPPHVAGLPSPRSVTVYRNSATQERQRPVASPARGPCRCSPSFAAARPRTIPCEARSLRRVRQRMNPPVSPPPGRPRFCLTEGPAALRPMPCTPGGRAVRSGFKAA